MAKNSESIGFKQLHGNNEVKLAKDSEGAGGLSLKIDVDVSGALKGLKAVQREAKKTARILREVEGLRSFNPVINITMNSTDDPKKFAKALNIEIEKLSKEW